MPGAYRYSATFDKPYVENPSPPTRSPVRFSIGSWRGSSAAPSSGGGAENGASVERLPEDDLPTMAKSLSSDEGMAPPLNGSFRHSARAASTDSLESASGGSVSGSSAASSSGGSGAHSRQVSMEGSDFGNSRLISGKMPVASAATASHNPLQFVKVGPVPLYKKAEEQIKIAKEKKISRECIKENEEAWQSNLDSWKNRRRKMSEKSLQRLEEMKQIEEREKNLKANNAKVKTFSEMMEERAQKPRSYNLSIYVNNSEEDLTSLENGSPTQNMVRTNENSTSSETDFIELHQSPNITEGNLNSSSLRNILVTERIERKETYHSEGCSGSADDGFAEEDGNLYGIYTGDSGLESFGSSQRIGDLADSSSELSTDSGSVYDRVGNDHDTGSASSLGHITTGTDLLREFSSSDQKSWPSNLEQKDNHIQRNLRISISPQSKTKDFGFTIKVDRTGDKPTSATIDSVQAGSLSQHAGLLVGDEIMAVNGELSQGRSHSSLMFSVKQSVYRGHLDLVISRHESNDTFSDDRDAIDGQSRARARSHVGPAQRRLLNNRSFDDTWQNKNVNENNFRTRSKSESSRSPTTWSARQKSASLDEKFPKARDLSPEIPLESVSKKPPIAQKPKVRKVPPPVPAKPKFAQFQTESTNEAIFADAIQRLDEIASTDSKRREPTDEREQPEEDERDTNYAVEQSNILDDMVQSENEDAASHRVTPLLRTLSDGLRDSTSSPQFILKQDHACFSDFNESEQDTEKEIEPEPDISGANFCDFKEDNIRTVSVPDPAPSTEVGSSAPLARDTQDDHQVPQATCDFEEDATHSFPLNPLYKDSDGFNIVYQSHEEESSPILTDTTEVPTSFVTNDAISLEQPIPPAAERSTSVVEDTDVTFIVDPESLPNGGSNTDMDERLLADLESAPRLAQPPTEKPPPPPPVDRESPERSNDGVVMRTNTFKRVKKEIWKRRSDFLGIDPSTDEVDIDVPPPPDISEILKSERAIERQGRVLLERERSNSLHYRNEYVPDLTQKESEIIRNLEQEEKLKKRFTDQDDHELVTAESGNKTCVRVDDDERIKRLQDERRRMSEERILREEERISMEEERMFREREEQLRLKETDPEEFVEPVLNDTNFESALRPLPSENSNNGTRKELTPTTSTRNAVSASSSAEITMDTAEALQRDRERLREEQEALRREREKYRCQIELEQQGIFARTPAEADPRHNSLPNQREAAMWISKQAQRYQDDDVDDDLEHVILRNKSNEQDVRRQSSPSSQTSPKDALHILGAAPKAKIIQNEQWIGYNNDKVAKRRSEPAPPKESRYNQNHWLLHEAEMRRISEQNERQRLQQSPEKRYSLQNSLPQYKSSLGNGLGTLPSSGRDPLSRIPPPTAPRPYERPPAPPKPSHVVPNEPWNYERVPAPTANSPNSKKAASRPSISPEEYRNPQLGKYSHNRSLVPPPHPPPTEPQPQEQFLSVSGKERCSHCGEPLGHGGAMIIESLQLCYHMRCFCCCVCQAQLGNGLCGTDVRVRSNKLHCQNCYSNDEAGLKFSQV